MHPERSRLWQKNRLATWLGDWFQRLMRGWYEMNIESAISIGFHLKAIPNITAELMREALKQWFFENGMNAAPCGIACQRRHVSQAHTAPRKSNPYGKIVRWTEQFLFKKRERNSREKVSGCQCHLQYLLFLIMEVCSDECYTSGVLASPVQWHRQSIFQEILWPFPRPGLYLAACLGQSGDPWWRGWGGSWRSPRGILMGWHTEFDLF